MQEILNLYLEESDDSEYLASLPKKSIKSTPSIVEVQVDPSVALAFFY